MENKIAFVVPTKDREKDLRLMLSSLVCQTRIPDQIIVVDGSDPDIKFVINEFNELPIDYIREFPPSLSKQRNAGIEKLHSDITLAGYLDDDIVLESDAVENMLAFWDEADTGYGGAAFCITNAKSPAGTGIKQLFFLDSPERGKVLPSGWVSQLFCSESPESGKVLPSGWVSTSGNSNQIIDVDWLCGGVTVWRREVVDNYLYDEWFQGTGFMEDVDFSFNVRKKYKLTLVANAKVADYPHPILPERYILLGKWQIVNRLYFVRKYSDRGLSITKAWLSSFSVILLNLTLGLIRADTNRFRCALGNILGIGIALTDKNRRIGGHLK